MIFIRCVLYCSPNLKDFVFEILFFLFCCWSKKMEKERRFRGIFAIVMASKQIINIHFTHVIIFLNKKSNILFFLSLNKVAEVFFRNSRILKQEAFIRKYWNNERISLNEWRISDIYNICSHFASKILENLS